MEAAASSEVQTVQHSVDLFWEVIPRVWNLTRSHVRSIATERFGLTVEQFHILRHIWKGVDSVSELAEARQISRPAISQSVDLLAEKGLVSRTQNPDDRRFVQLKLTEEGQQVLAQIFDNNRAWTQAKFERMSPEELAYIAGAFQALKAAFADPPPNP